MLGHIYPLLFAVRNPTSNYPLLMQHPNGFIGVRTRFRPGVCKPLYLVRSPFTIVLNLNGGQEVTPIFMS